jgi:DnaJ homologue, subfamily C, member 28, conserved domain
MTERKPPQMKFSTWIDQQVADAERRGVFDNLPGAGKPLNVKPGAPDGDYGQAWLRDYASREGVPAEEMLPTPLRLRREMERLAETAGEFRSEAEVREAAADLNRRIVEWRRIPLGPPVHVRLVNADDLAARWRAAQAARGARPAAPRPEEPPRPPPARARRRRSWRPWGKPRGEDGRLACTAARSRSRRGRHEPERARRRLAGCIQLPPPATAPSRRFAAVTMSRRLRTLRPRTPSPRSRT